MLAFYALEPRWFRWDRYYKVYLSDRAMHVAYLAAQVYDNRSAELSSAGLGSLRRMAQRQLVLLKEREGEYDRMDLGTPAFIRTDERNFTLARAEIRQVDLVARFSMWLAGKGGVLTIHRADLTKIKLLLPTSQPETAFDALRALQAGTDQIDAFEMICLKARPAEQAE